ncbi:MAG: pirin family protein [Verrucomicrobiales bacterium]|nr:pirin family protein [Verrucomicrobiales bacterium]
MKNQVHPILTKRPAAERGQANHGWLQANFTFSFGEYFDPDHMGFKSLRVMNNDTIQPGGGFPEHPHDNMEIFTYIIEGQLEHRDSMGNGATIKAGDLQYMSAGSGIQHSEFNPSKTKPTHLYQIWLQPNQRDGEPRYAEKPLGELVKDNQLTLLFSADGRDGSTAIRQDAEIYFGEIEKNQSVAVPTSSSSPHVWIQVISGNITMLGESLTTGDGLAIQNAADEFLIKTTTDTKLLLFRLS